MLSGFLRLIPILLLAGIAGLIGESFVGDELGWLFAVFIIVFSLFIAYVNQSRLDVFVKGAGISQLSGFGGAWAEIFFKLQRIITGLRKDIEQAERQHKRFIEAFQASPNGIVMLDDQDQIEWCNAIAEHFLGIELKRDVLQRIHYIVRKPEFVQYITERHYEEPIVLEKMSSSNLILRLQAFPFSENRRLVLIQDITDLSKAEAMRRDFVANVSHELKTPIASIKGFVETLLDGAADDPVDNRRFLQIVAKQADRLAAIIEDLLALSRIEQSEGAGTLPLEPTRIADVLTAVIGECAPRAAEKSIRLVTACEDDLTAEVNPPLLEQALINLADNAIKYSDDGRTTTIDAVAEGVDGTAQLVLSVRDEGRGIAPEHLPRLFERFYRVDSARSRALGGTGLGLSIVKHIAQAHGGTVTVESTVGVGTTFTMRLPLARD